MSSRVSGVVSLLLLLLLLAVNVVVADVVDDDGLDEVDAAPQVTLDYITLEGTALSSGPGINTFKGIPFAAPPVGTLRWNPPQAPTAVTGVYQATKFGNACMGGGSPQSEDCLFVNVWTPATATAESKLPVFVWIYGGAFVGGSSNSYDGEPVLRGMNYDVVFVSLNYRMGLFGFLTNAAVLAEGNGANWGFQDELAALGWVNKYISAFGGDPQNVTLYGQSAGSMSTAMLMIANGGSQTLFQHAIGESGSYMSIHDVQNITTQNEFTATAAKAAGCPSATGTALMTCLRAADANTLQNAAGNLAWRPSVDGVLFKDMPSKLVENGEISLIPAILGTNTNEGTVFAMSVSTDSQVEPFVTSTYPSLSADNVSTIMNDLYPASAFTSALFRAAEIFGDTTFVCPSEHFAQVRFKLGAPMFRYRFNHLPESGGMSQFGVMHGAEIPFVFNESAQVAADEQPIVTLMMGAWKALGLTGNPSTAAAKWPLYEADQQQIVIDKTMVVETDGAYMPNHSKRCTFWAAIDAALNTADFYPPKDAVTTNEPISHHKKSHKKPKSHKLRFHH